jgi:hypothetical protein
MVAMSIVARYYGELLRRVDVTVQPRRFMTLLVASAASAVRRPLMRRTQLSRRQCNHVTTRQTLLFIIDRCPVQGRPETGTEISHDVDSQALIPCDLEALFRDEQIIQSNVDPNVWSAPTAQDQDGMDYTPLGSAAEWVLQR